jgi:hypothetical protein
MLNSHRVLSFAISLCLVACVDVPDAPPPNGGDVDQLTVSDIGPNVAAGDLMIVAPPAPAASADAAPRPPSSDEGEAAVASSPTISPADSAPGADFEFLAPGGTVNCAAGTFCAGVWDPTVSKFKVFKLFFCHRYALSHWLGDGFYLNNQTGSGTRTTFYRQDGSQIVSFTRGNQTPALVAYGWTPVWSIRNCE